ncbi:Ig-like domain-containing protein, partial [Vibrio sp. F13]|uniref:Ig-like domain-containing protein n=1 Tax=Vibrio sp. F13 TaxID=2070777 RepID=UPI0014850574
YVTCWYEGLSITALDGSAIADNADLVEVRVTLQDDNGPVQGEVINAAVTSGSATFDGADSKTTGSDGRVHFQLKSGTVGLVDITATYQSFSVTVEVAFGGDADWATVRSLTPILAYADPDGVSQVELEALLQDAGKAAVVGEILSITDNSAVAELVEHPSQVKTDVNGKALFHYQQSQADVKEEVSITATYTSVFGGTTTQTANVYFGHPIITVNGLDWLPPLSETESLAHGFTPDDT